MNADWHYPTEIRAGVGRVGELAAVCDELGITAPLLVTDPGLVRLGTPAPLVKNCAAAGLRVEVFSDIKANPNGDNVAAGMAAYRRGGHDGVIALGGGSALDVGKTIAVAAHQTCAIWDLEDVGDNWRRADAARIAPTIALPTTAGTGSEVGRAALIVHAAEGRKVIIFHPKMLPACVLLDAQLTVGLPPNLTAATGMDALSHNLEAYCSPAYHPLAEGIAIEGMRLIKNHLPTAVQNGADLAARSAMLTASTMGATAFQRGLGAMHALAHPLGAIYDAHHGTLNAVLMPYVLRKNRPVIEARIARLARYLDLPPNFDGFLAWTLTLRRRIGIPHDLSQLGIDTARVDEIGAMAAVDPCAATNPQPLDAIAYRDLLIHAIEGNLDSVD